MLTRFSCLAMVLAVATVVACDSADQTDESAPSPASVPSTIPSSSGMPSTAAASTSSASEDVAAYCERLEEGKQALDAEQEPGMGGLISQGQLEQYLLLADEITPLAPEEVSEHWVTIGQTVHAFDDLLDSAGLDADDLSTLSEAVADPESVDPTLLERVQPITDELDELLSDPATEQAFDSIDAHAEPVCGITLEGG